MPDLLFIILVTVGSFSTVILTIGLISYFLLVAPYIWLIRFKDKVLWKEMGSPSLGLGMSETLPVMAFLWRRDYKDSKVLFIVFLSNILRVIYLKAMIIGGVGFLIYIAAVFLIPGYHEWLQNSPYLNHLPTNIA